MLPKKRMLFYAGLVVLGVILLVACGTAPQVPTSAPTSAATAAPTQAPLTVPFKDTFLSSGHADATGEPFNHWNTADPAEVPATCARCHTSAGFQDFVATGKVNAAVPAPAGTLDCVTCHNPAAMALTSVTFPSGLVVNTTEPGEARCMTCHQGRESKVSVDKQITDFNATDPDAVPAPIKGPDGKDKSFGFLNVHYFAAGATLYGAQAEGGYQYEGKSYDVKFRHVAGVDTCIACHDQHATQVRVEKCAECHEGVKTVDDLKNNRMNGSLEDYNGNGDIKEGIFYEVKGVHDTLLTAIRAYAKEVAGAPIAYDGATYPYFLVADDSGAPVKDADGKTTAYNKWTPRLLEAAYNYQFVEKDPGSYAHNAKYVIELMYDSIADLNTKLSSPIDMSKMAREDAGHFAGDTEPFRHWDENASGNVDAPCSKCHSATGMATFIANKGGEFVTKSGLQYTGLVGEPVSNGFLCTTCHDGANFPNRIAVTTVPFPSGAVLTFSTEKDADGNLKPVDANLCIECHQGRESTATINTYLGDRPVDTVDPKMGFKNVHYLAAGATLFGDAAKGAYQYDNQTYLGQNVTHPLNKCTDCHDAHALTVKVDTCKGCHPNVTGEDQLAALRATTDTTDWNGNGDTTEGISAEVDGFAQTLLASIQSYAETKAGTPITYSASAYPYFFVDANKDGKPDQGEKGNIAYNAWTPRLLKAAYNYQFYIKDPGAFAHNPQYIMQVLYDSIKDLGGDVSKLTRPETPAPAAQ